MKTLIKFKLFLASLVLAFLPAVYAGQVALTIDDLPFVGNQNTKAYKLRLEKERFYKILDTLKEKQVTATGFVVTGTIGKDQYQLLEDFQIAGNVIANHTHTHRSLSRTAADTFIEDIAKADQILKPLINGQKYFRYPYLATGSNCKTKAAVRNYLLAQEYQIVPVTIDAKDFEYNQQLFNVPYRSRPARLPAFRERYISFIDRQITKAEKKAMKNEGREIKHIFLIHMNLLNAHFIGDIIDHFRSRGYEFITLAEALKDPVYQIDPVEQSMNHLNCNEKLANN